ncbi:MAG: metalloprotease TldD [Rhodanobacteraceae bacterium]|nr:metalloprotease TldD [Rhodanobacteraceae bacterium]
MTDSAIALAQRQFLSSGLDLSMVERALGALLGPGVDGADLYFQHTRHEGWGLEDGIVKEGSHNIEQGVGVRAVSGEKVGFAYSDAIDAPALMEAASSARAIARTGGSGAQARLVTHEGRALYPAIDPIDSASAEAKVALLKEIDAYARSLDPRVQQVMVSLAAETDTILIAQSDGTLAADVRPLMQFRVQVIAEGKGRREAGFSGGGGRRGFDEYLSGDAARAHAREAVRQALVNLDSVPAPAGSMTVVLGSGWPGVLLHEAIGHGLEGDFNRKGTSAFSGRMGQQVANPLVTVVDDGTLVGRRGSLNIDDEGTVSQCTTLIENGVLKGYLFDKLNARLMGTTSTGNGRRESFAHLPMPRMTNTYMRPGPHEREEIIRSVKKGLYAVNFGGGQVDITSGKFVFSASEAYLIENGKITVPVKGATLIGNGPDVLTRVSMVGNDLELDQGVGVCGKDGQSVPVGVGQPTLRVDALTVGGTQ